MDFRIADLRNACYMMIGFYRKVEVRLQLES